MTLPKFLQVIKDWVDGWPQPDSVTEIKAETSSGAKGKLGGSYKNVPAKWAWILGIEGLPKLVQEGMRELGVVEGPSTSNNPTILKWADEVEKLSHSAYNDWAADWYNKDSIAWCGLFTALICARTGRAPVNKYLSALAWAGWGKSVNWNKLSNIWTGDIAVFSRTGGGHVAIIIGVSKDNKYLLCLGGNQDNAVSIKLFPVSRLYSVRRPAYNVAPMGAKFRQVSSTGVPISTNEA